MKASVLMRLVDAFVPPLENIAIVNARDGIGIFLMPYTSPVAPRLDCLMLEWALTGQPVRHNYENVSTRPNLNFEEWNLLAERYGLPADGWVRYVRDSDH